MGEVPSGTGYINPGFRVILQSANFDDKLRFILSWDHLNGNCTKLRVEKSRVKPDTSTIFKDNIKYFVMLK